MNLRAHAAAALAVPAILFTGQVTAPPPPASVTTGALTYTGTALPWCLAHSTFRGRYSEAGLWAEVEWYSKPSRAGCQKPNWQQRVKVYAVFAGNPGLHKIFYSGWVSAVGIWTRATPSGGYLVVTAWAQARKAPGDRVYSKRWHGPAAAARELAACETWNWYRPGDRDAKSWWQCNTARLRERVRLRCRYPGFADYPMGPWRTAVNTGSYATCGPDGSLRTILVCTKARGSARVCDRVWRY